MYGECRLISPNNTGSTAHSVEVTHRNAIVGVCFCTSCGPQWKRDISSVFSYICSAATAFFLFFVTAWKRPDCCCCEDVSLIMEGEGATGGRDPHYTTCQMVQDHAACVDEFRHSCRWWWHSKAHKGFPRRFWLAREHICYFGYVYGISCFRGLSQFWKKKLNNFWCISVKMLILCILQSLITPKVSNIFYFQLVSCCSG